MSMKKLVMVLENAGSNLAVDKSDKNEYVLEGIFAQFGVENNNNRIYEEKEYLPHLEYLKKKINENRLLGELDHPDKFDISLQKVSHLIEDVKYDSKKRQIIGRIKLLDTPSGQIAKNLVDSGVPISISSRAAGVVKENKLVEIKRIFTYDLVADPGFENAQMKKINESLGIMESNVAVYDMTEREPEYLKMLEDEEIYTSTTNDNPNPMTEKEFVSSEKMQEYSMVVKAEIEAINEKLEKLATSAANEAKLVQLTEEVNNLKLINNALTRKVEDLVGYAQKVAEHADSGLQVNDELRAKIDEAMNLAKHGIAYTEDIARTVDRSIQYTEKVAEMADHGIQYAEGVSKNSEKILEYANYVGARLNKGLNFANHLAKRLNETIGYAEHIAEHADNGIRYSEFLAENASSKEDVKALTEYAEFMFEGIHKGGVKEKEEAEPKKDGEEGEEGVLKDALKESKPVLNRLATLDERINSILSEVTPVNKVNESVATIDQKIQAVLESVNKKRAESISDETRYPFIKFLSEEKQTAFKAMNETEKQKVARALESKPTFKEEGILKVWEEALATVEVNEKWLTEMPTEYLQLWESADAATKERVIRQAKLYNLEQPYQIKNFWQTRGLGKPADEATAVNESATAAPGKDKEQVSALGYSNDYLASIREQLKNRQR